MKEYLTNVRREHYKYCIFVISFVLTSLFNFYLYPKVENLYSYLETKNESLYHILQLLGLLLGPLTLPLIYNLIFNYFENKLWKCLFKIRLISQVIPDLNGEWVGKLTSSRKNLVDGLPIERKVKVTISQTFSKINIKSEFFDNDKQTSTSYSSLCCLNNFDSYFDLEFIFHNTSEEVHTVSKEYLGFNKFKINKEVNLMKGSYFTGRDSEQNHGKIELIRLIT